MISKDGTEYEVIIIRSRSGCEFSRLIDVKEIPWIKAGRVVKRMRKDYKRHHHVL